MPQDKPTPGGLAKKMRYLAVHHRDSALDKLAEEDEQIAAYLDALQEMRDLFGDTLTAKADDDVKRYLKIQSEIRRIFATIPGVR